MTAIIGVDPGEITGICMFVVDGNRYPLRAAALHATALGVMPAVKGLMIGHPGIVVAVEDFVVRGRAARSRTASAGKVARELVAELRALTEGSGYTTVFIRSAGLVKPWATDERLHAAGLFEPLSKLRHARDAARHALYAARHDLNMPDPLSRKAQR